MEKEESPVYAREVIEFVTVANEFCNLLENVKERGVKDLVNILHKLLSLLYYKAITLPRFEPDFDESIEKFVTEEDYNYIHESLLKKLGEYDSYDEVFDPIRQETEDPVSASLAENFSDIYQDLKDFLMLYRVSPAEIMNDAVWECQQNFERYWGQKLVNALRALHKLNYQTELREQGEKPEIPSGNKETDIDTSNWILTKRQQEYRDEE